MYPATMDPYHRLDTRSVPTSSMRQKQLQVTRPNTVATGTKPECTRLYQVEHEGTRKQILEAHLPTRKNKAPPWQKRLDLAGVAPVPVVVSPGYTMAKSKNKIVMHIRTDAFFDEAHQHEHNSNKRMDPESTALIGQLQSQIDDLTLFLEEERINHKDTKRKAADLLRDQIESLQHQHANTVKSMEEKHTEEVEEIRADYDKLIFENQKYFDTNTVSPALARPVITKMRGEIEFLQGAFESYKTQLLQEMEVKWSKKTSELETNYKTEMDKKLHELKHPEPDPALTKPKRKTKSRMTMERSHENAKASKDHQQEVAGLKREHKKEVDALMRRFANHAADQNKLEETQTRLDEVESEYKTIKEDYDRVCRQVTTMASELTDTKLRLLDFEKNFDEKIEEIDDKYKAQMHELMTQNAEIRRQYVKKCDELFTAKALAETNRREKIGSAKDAMKLLIETRERCAVSVAAGNPTLEKKYPPRPVVRPASAPSTQLETDAAQLSAGNTDEFFEKKRRQKEQNKKQGGYKQKGVGIKRPQTSPHVQIGGLGGLGGGRRGSSSDQQQQQDVENLLLSALTTNNIQNKH